MSETPMSATQKRAISLLNLETTDSYTRAVEILTAACDRLPGDCLGDNERGAHDHIVHGQSGDYMITVLPDGTVIDTRPWQMLV